MKKKLHFLTISFIILFFSCDNEITHESAFKDSNNDVTVLLERDNNYPLKLVSDSYIERNKMNTRSVQPEPPSSSFTNYLGQGYNVTAIPIADAAYITSPIISVSKLLRNPNDSSSYYRKLRYSRAYPEFFAFSKYDKYSHNNQVSDKVEGGGSINLGLFNIGAKKTVQTVFKNNFTEIDSTAYAELHLNIYKHIYRMNIVTEYDKQKFALNYLHPVFIEDLYNSAPQEILNKYGEFLLKGFYTGGTCSALFGSKFHGTYNEQSRETILSDSVYAGFKMEENAANGNLYIKLGRSESSSTSNNTSTIFLTMKTVGGSSGYPTAFGIPVKFSNVNINLSAWGTSLDTNEDNHELIDLTDGGLLPIRDLILEENIQDGIKYASTGSYSIQEPYLEIRKTVSRNGTFYNVLLCSRLGYYISISTNISNFNNAQDIANYLRDYFKALRIILVKDNRGDPETIEATAPNVFVETRATRPPSGNPEDRDDRFPYKYILDKTKMKKYINTETGITYLLFDDGTNKHAFSIYEDFILDTYGLRELVNSVPKTDLTIQQLTQYQILAL